MGLGDRENGRNFLPVSLVEKVDIYSISQEPEMIDVKCITCVQNLTRRDLAIVNFRVCYYFVLIIIKSTGY